MASGKNDADEGPSEEASSQEENYEGNRTGLSETYDMRDFCPGISIEVQDFDGKWYAAKVADVDWTENEILVHFEDKNTKFDEWMPMDSSRLRSLPKPLVSTPKEIVRFAKGEEVMAMWSPYQKYPATIQAVLTNDRYDVLFYDGFLKRLKGHKISKVDGGIVRSEVKNFSDIGTKEERRERKRKINVAELFHVNKRSKKKGLVHSKTQEMKTYPVNKSRARSSIIKKTVQVPEEKEDTGDDETATMSAKPVDMKPQVPVANSCLSRSLIDTIPAAVKVKYVDGRTEMWSKQLYQRSEGRTAGKLDIVILNPQGRKFRSRNEIMKYCEENGIIYSHEAFDFSAKGRPKSKSVVQESPVKTEATQDEGEKISLKRIRRKSQMDESATGAPATQIPPVPVESNNFTEDKIFIGDVEVVVENGKFICPVKVCGKHFRRENLLHMHVKHYHPEFSKFLDYTPSVTDLAYMRTVGSLESGESSPSASRKSGAMGEKSEKAPAKTEKSNKSNILVSEGNKEVKKTAQKSVERQNESRVSLSKFSTHVGSSAPATASHESSEESKSSENKSVSDTFQVFKDKVPVDVDQTATQENKVPFRQEPSSETAKDSAEGQSSSGNVSKTIKHSRFYRQKRGTRIRSSFADHIKRKKFNGQDLSRSNFKLGRQQQQQQQQEQQQQQKQQQQQPQLQLQQQQPKSQPQQPQIPHQTPMQSSSQPTVEEHSNLNASSQAPSSKTPKLQLPTTNEASGNDPSINYDSAVAGEKVKEENGEKKKKRDPQRAYVLLENYLLSDAFLEGGKNVKSKENFGARHGVKRKGFDVQEKRCGSKKVLFESLACAKRSDSDNENGDLDWNRYEKVHNGTGRLDRCKKDRKRCINYLGKKDANGANATALSINNEYCSTNIDLSSDLDHTEGTEDSKSPFTVENEKVEKLRRNEIINCLCGVTEEDGLMIQCDICLCWQHGHCMDILRDTDVPDKYTCSICKNPFRGRSSMRYIHDQEWLKEGTLPCLSFRSKREDIIEQRRTILKRSYDLSGSISLLSRVIHSLRVKVNIAEKKDHPKLWLWAKKWIEKKQTRLIEEVKEEKPDESVVGSGKTEGLLPGEEQQLPKVPEPEAPIDSAECRLNLLDHLIHYQTLVDARLSCIESLVAELESMQDDAVDDEGPDRYPRTKATIQMILRDLNTMKKIAAI